MASIKLFGNIHITKTGFEKGKTPKQLEPYLFKKDGIPKECAERTKHLKGAKRVLAMNSCIAELKKKLI